MRRRDDLVRLPSSCDPLPLGHFILGTRNRIAIAWWHGTNLSYRFFNPAWARSDPVPAPFWFYSIRVYIMILPLWMVSKSCRPSLANASWISFRGCGQFRHRVMFLSGTSHVRLSESVYSAMCFRSELLVAFRRP